MYDELARIERNYGCVAEYNRCMLERDYEEYEPTEEELEQMQREHEEYRARIKAKDGTPSAEAVELLTEMENNEPKRSQFPDDGYGYNQYVYACWDYAEKLTKRTIELIKQVYGIKFDKELNPYSPREEGKYNIQIRMPKTNPIDFYSVVGIDYETFCRVFCDLYYLQQSPTAFLSNKVVSNSSLGELRIQYLREED